MILKARNFRVLSVSRAREDVISTSVYFTLEPRPTR